MAIEYKIVTIEDFQNDVATKALLDAEGIADWILTDITFQPNEETGKSTAICIFRK